MEIQDINNMIKIRSGVFETNSSSTHSLSICKKSDCDKWINGELMYCKYPKDNNKEFVSIEEGNKINKQRTIDYHNWIELNDDDSYVTEEDFDVEDLEIMVFSFIKYDPDSNYLTFEDYEKILSEYNYEPFKQEYKTKHGDQIVTFGYYE